MGVFMRMSTVTLWNDLLQQAFDAFQAFFSLLTLQDAHEEHDSATDNADDSNHDPQFEPIVSLPEQEIRTLEEDEEELFKM